MHFFADFLLGGNEIIKVAEYQVRHLPKLDGQKIKSKAYYPEIFKRAAEPGEVAIEDFSFLQNVPDLKIWH